MDDERGASAVEYGLLITGITAIVVVTVFLFGGYVQGMFTTTCDKFEAQADYGRTCTP